MQICPNCAKERDQGDLFCVHCGHAGPLEAIPIPRPPALREQRNSTTRNVLIGSVATALVVAVLLIMGLPGREAQKMRAALPAATPAATSSALAGHDADTRGVGSAAGFELTATPKWKRTRQSRWATDGSKTMGFELEAERDIAVYMDRVRPVLAVRCVSRYTEVFIVLQSAASIENAGDTHTVKVSLDGEPDVEQQWVDSTDKQALFAPNAEALAARMAASRRMRFSFTPFNAPTATVDFDVHGFEEPLAAMSKTCVPPKRARGSRG